ncbi:MAG: EAL domain-containing protein [Coxiellaceae bacterium]|nr:EAL domain-containing protein [Coxiellaceae bacterium]
MDDCLNIENTSDLLNLLNSSLNEIYIFNQHDFKFLWVNKGAMCNTQYGFDEFEKMTPLSLKPDHDQYSFAKLIKPLDGNKVKVQFETRHRRKDGTDYYVEVHLEKGIFQNQQVYIAIILDITEKVSVDESLKQLADTEKSLSNVLKHSLNEIYIFYQDTLEFAWVNLKALSNLGYTMQELNKMTPLDFEPGFTAKDFDLILNPLVTHKKNKVKIEALHRRKDGSMYNVEVHLQMENFNGKPAFVAIILDITKRKLQDERIDSYVKEKVYQAHHDAITELPNRRALSEDIVVQLMSHEYQDLALVFIDLDNFKDINDTLGHQAGDTMLLETSLRLNKLKNEGDFLIKFGGDEFLYIIKDKSKLENIDLFCQSVLATISEPYFLDENKRIITASIGLSRTIRGEHTVFNEEVLNAMIRYADFALTTAKQTGKNNYYIFDEGLDRKLQKRSYYLSKFNNAIDLDRFEIEYHPILNLQNKTIIGAEALLRWRPEGNLIYPNEFIPLLEETGKICEVGIWVLAKIYEFAEKNSEILGKKFKFCFNASVVQLNDKGFYSAVKCLIEKYKHLDCIIEMEITESVFAYDMRDITEIISLIRELGIKISVDDFGTGYSCLEYLRSLPIDTLKIDKRFIDDCLDKKGFSILQSIITLAAGLNLNVIAEGIETNDQHKCLSSLMSIYPNCIVDGQGYLFYKPMGPERLTALFNEDKSV